MGNSDRMSELAGKLQQKIKTYKKQIGWHCPLFGKCCLSKCGPRLLMPSHILLKQAIMILSILTSEVFNDHDSLWSSSVHKTLNAKMLSESYEVQLLYFN